MAIWIPTEQYMIPGDIGDIHTKQHMPLGTIINARDIDSSDLGTGRFIYLAGAASTVLGDLVTYDEAFATTRADADDVGRCAVATAATVAANWGWYQIEGVATVTVLAGFAAGAAVYLTSTDGSVDDAAVAGDMVIGAIGQSATGTPATGKAYVSLNNPIVVNEAID